MEKRKVFFTNSRGQKLGGYLYIPDGKGPFPTVVFVHGFTGGTHEIKNRYMCDMLADNGFVALIFDFYDKPNGLSEPSIEDTNVTNQVADTDSALDFVRTFGFVDKNRIGLTGHSLGGMTVVLYASRYHSIKALVVQSPVVEFGKGIGSSLRKFDSNDVRKSGYLELKKSWGNLRIKYSFYEDGTKYDVAAEVEKITCPTLVFHGEKDETIGVKEGKTLFEHIRAKEKKFEAIKGADHSYYNYGTLDVATKLMIGWFKKYL
jgi:dienelactone hydrolase